VPGETLAGMENWFRKIWEHRVTSWLLVSVGFTIAVFFILHSPVPGVAVTLLGVVAAIMSIRPLSSVEKFLYTTLVFTLLYAEIHAITIDRREQLRHQLEDRTAQEQAFQSVRDKQDEDFSSTASGLEAAISGIKSTLVTADKTLIQTAPHAAIRFTDFKFAEANPGDTIHPGSFPFNTSIVNKGNDTALVQKELIGIYTGIPDNKAEQERLVKLFTEEWNKKRPQSTKLFTDIPSINTTYHELTREDINGFQASTKTIYFLTRIEYSDSSGVWYSEDCEAFQNTPEGLDVVLRHSCFVFRDSRMPVKRR